MTASILLRSPTISPTSSPASPAYTPLPALQPDLSSSSSSSTSGSCLDLHRTTSSRSRRIRFAPLPDPTRDFLEPLHLASDDPQSGAKPTPQTSPVPSDTHDDFVALSPSVSPASTLSSARSTPTIRTSKNTSRSGLKLFHSISFLRRGTSSLNGSPLSRSSSLPGSRDSSSSLVYAPSSVPSSPSYIPTKLARISTEDILTLGTKSLFRARSGSANGTRPPRPSSPPPKPSDSTKSRHRSASTGSGPGMNLGSGKRDWGEGSSLAHHAPATASSSPTTHSSSSSPGAGGGRHASSAKMVANDPPRPSTAPSLSSARPKKHVKMLNGRIYGGKRYAAQTLANPFATARDEPVFVEWGYGGMGSVHASAGIANDMWKGLQRSERGGALLSGSSSGSPAIAGDGRGTGTRMTSPIVHRKMSNSVPECGMGNVGSGGDEDDGSGMAWVKRRRAEKEAKARLEEAARELDKKTREGRKSGDSMDASMGASTASTATSLTACTSGASTDLTTPTTSPFTSRPPSVDMKLTSSPSLHSRDLPPTPSPPLMDERSLKADTPPEPVPVSKDEHEHHVLTAIRLSPNISGSSHRYATQPSPPLALSQTRKGRGTEQVAPLSPVDTEAATVSTNSDEEEQGQGPDEEERDVDDDEEEVQDISRKTALGAGVEKVSRHVEVEVR